MFELTPKTLQLPQIQANDWQHNVRLSHVLKRFYLGVFANTFLLNNLQMCFNQKVAASATIRDAQNFLLNTHFIIGSVDILMVLMTPLAAIQYQFRQYKCRHQQD